MNTAAATFRGARFVPILCAACGGRLEDVALVAHAIEVLPAKPIIAWHPPCYASDVLAPQILDELIAQWGPPSEARRALGRLLYLVAFIADRGAERVLRAG